MAISLDATSSVNNTTNDANSVSFNHVISGANRLLFVDVAVSTSVTPSVTAGGVAMTLLGSLVDNTGNGPNRYGRFYLLAPAVGTIAIVISKGGVSTTTYALSHSYTGVKAVHNHTSTNNNSSASSISISGATASDFYVDYCSGNNSTGSGMAYNSSQSTVIAPQYFHAHADETAVGYLASAATGSGYTLGFSQPAMMFATTLEAGTQPVAATGGFLALM